MRWTRRSNLDRVRRKAPGHPGASRRGKHEGDKYQGFSRIPKMVQRAVVARGILGRCSS